MAAESQREALRPPSEGGGPELDTLSTLEKGQSVRVTDEAVKKKKFGKSDTI